MSLTKCSYAWDTGMRLMASSRQIVLPAPLTPPEGKWVLQLHSNMNRLRAREHIILGPAQICTNQNETLQISHDMHSRYDNT